jgi:hypothetical protein
VQVQEINLFQTKNPSLKHPEMALTLAGQETRLNCKKWSKVEKPVFGQNELMPGLALRSEPAQQ